jgi:putative hydrolase of the HAD superfamily
VPDLGGALLGALRFRPYPEVVATLEAWRDRGVRRVVASNWDVSLHEVLATTGLAPLLDGVVTSAELGVAKPDPRLLHAALDLAGADPVDALHVGDSVEHDVGAAQAAGIAVALVAARGSRCPRRHQACGSSPR